MANRNRSIEHATLNDVARAAGVSRATAARALGGYGAVSQEARERVLETASRLRYRANVLARSMRSGTSHTIGVIVADIGLAYFAQAVRGIADAAKASGFEVILANSDEDLAKERAALGVLMDKRVDGLIVAPASVREVEHLIEAGNRGLPIVLLDRGTTRIGGDIVVVDNHAAAKAAVAHLVGLGHRRIAIVLEGAGALSASAAQRASPALTEAMTSTLRQIGWAAGFREAGLLVTDDLIHRTMYEIASARAATARALAAANRPSALLTTDETMTIGALDAIGEAGLRIPEEISIVAFDDPSWASVMRPPLTVIAQPVHELGVAAADRLLARIGGDERPPEVVVLSTEFAIRGSTAPAPAPRT
jgi:LacI family transcriptional regulator